MRTRKVDLLVRGFTSGLGVTFPSRGPDLAKQLYEASCEAQLYQNYSYSDRYVLRIHGVTLPADKDCEGDAVAEKLQKFFGLKYMIIDSYDVEIVDEKQNECHERQGRE